MSDEAKYREALTDIIRMSFPGRGYSFADIRRRAQGAMVADRFCRCSQTDPCDSWKGGGLCVTDDRGRAPTPEQREAPAPTCRGLVGGGDDALFAAWTGAANVGEATKPCAHAKARFLENEGEHAPEFWWCPECEGRFGSDPRTPGRTPT